MTASVSTVAKKGELATFCLDSMLTRCVVIRKRIAQTLVCSKEPAGYVRRKVILLPNVLTSLHPSVSIASRKVCNQLFTVRYHLFLTLSLGHQTSECKANRVFDKSLVADMSADDAWVALQKADEDRDLDDFREVRTSQTYPHYTKG